MKAILSIIFIFIINLSFGQQCKCDSNLNLNDIISCDVIHFKNKAKLYWQFNCDSSWLTFESKKGKKEILSGLEYPMVEYTERLGAQYAAEYNSTFLIQQNVISGCCTPPIYLLFDKEKGTIKKDLGSLIYYSDKSALPYIIYITDSTCNSLTLLNVDKRKKYKITLPKNRINKAMEMKDTIYPEFVFDETIFKNGKYIISYSYSKKGQGDKLFMGKVVIDIKGRDK